MTYENGSEASPQTGVYIHHLLAFVPSRPSTNAIGRCDVNEVTPENTGTGKFNNTPMSPFTGRGDRKSVV